MGRPVARPDFARAIGYALRRLRTELAPELVYHSLAHTRDDVVPAATRLAACEGVAGWDRALLRLGAYYHDLGFVEQRADHERAGMRIAQAVLPGFGFDPAAVAIVSGLILATRLPQTPHTALEAILADADLDVLGRADFWPRHRALRAELAAFGPPLSDAEWYRGQWHFLQAHRYFTRAARILRNPRKQQHLAELGLLLRQSETVVLPAAEWSAPPP